MTQILQSKIVIVIIGIVAYLITTILCWNTAKFTPSASGKTKLKPVPSWEYVNPEVNQLLEELNATKKALEEKEKQLNELALRLQTEHTELTTATQLISKIQKEFDSLIIRVKDEEAANLKKLVKIYTSMNPEDAAPILRQLPEEEYLKIFSLMKESELVPILQVYAQGSNEDKKFVAFITEKLKFSLTKSQTNNPAQRP